MKYAAPTDDGATVGPVFGRAKSFAIREDTGPMAIAPNEGANSEHGAGTGSAGMKLVDAMDGTAAPETIVEGYLAGTLVTGTNSCDH